MQLASMHVPTTKHGEHLRQFTLQCLEQSKGLKEGCHVQQCSGRSALTARVTHRCDLALVCSPVELHLLVSWGVPRAKLCLAPFFMDAPIQASLPGKLPPVCDYYFDVATHAMTAPSTAQWATH